MAASRLRHPAPRKTKKQPTATSREVEPEILIVATPRIAETSTPAATINWEAARTKRETAFGFQFALANEDLGASELDVGPLRLKTCVKKQKKGNEKADEAPKRPKLASDLTMYIFGRSRLAFVPPEEPVFQADLSNYDSEDEEMSIHSSRELRAGIEDVKLERQANSSPQSPVSDSVLSPPPLEAEQESTRAEDQQHSIDMDPSDAVLVTTEAKIQAKGQQPARTIPMSNIQHSVL